MHGFLNIDKPMGMTSHDVVAKLRRLTGQRRIGHAGTLDPSATGVLVVALGAATRLIEYIQERTTKQYLATVYFGLATDTDDAEGTVIATAPVPPLDIPALQQVLAGFRGAIMQIPPMYSALHHEGRRLHELARAGRKVDRPARAVRIEQLEILSWEPPVLVMEVECSKGTYIRSLARDMGAVVGCGAHLRQLRRTAIGTFAIAQSIPLATLEADPHHIPSMLLPPESAVADWPVVVLSQIEVGKVRNGQPIDIQSSPHDRARAHSPDGGLIALLARAGDQWRPTKVFDFI